MTMSLITGCSTSERGGCASLADRKPVLVFTARIATMMDVQNVRNAATVTAKMTSTPCIAAQVVKCRFAAIAGTSITSIAKTVRSITTVMPLRS